MAGVTSSVVGGEAFVLVRACAVPGSANSEPYVAAWGSVIVVERVAVPLESCGHVLGARAVSRTETNSCRH